MKPSPSPDKLRGGYYTPPQVAEFLAKWVVTSPTARVLEPSCGDGAILRESALALLERGATPAAVGRQLHAVEVNRGEVAKAVEGLTSLGVCLTSEQVHVGDFFSHCERHLLRCSALGLGLSAESEFDAVVGNPPFVRYQHFPEEHRAVAFRIMRAAGLHPNRLTNSWVPFLVLASFLLNPNGRLGMVIRAELLQVNYASEIRQFLSERFRKITIITFRRLLFDGVQQEVVLLLGEHNGSSASGIRMVELDSAEDLSRYDHAALSISPLKPMDHSTEKWTQYYLDAEEIQLLRRLKNDARIPVLGSLASVDVGVVTGLNEFFVLDEDEARKPPSTTTSRRSLTGTCVGTGRTCATTRMRSGPIARNGKWRS